MKSYAAVASNESNMIRRVFDVDSCGLSHAGRVRELNEDRYLVKVRKRRVRGR